MVCGLRGTALVGPHSDIRSGDAATGMTGGGGWSSLMEVRSGPSESMISRDDLVSDV